MKPTIKQLMQVLPDVLDAHGQDLVSATEAGRVFALMGADDVRPDGAFTWVVQTMELRELHQLKGGEHLEAGITRVRENNLFPVLLVGSDTIAIQGMSHNSN